jgi:GABA(A) receptor-associated protein
MYGCVDSNVNFFMCNNSLEERISMSSELRSRNSEKIPIIVGRSETKLTPSVTKFKFICNRLDTFGAFSMTLKSFMPKLDPNTTIFYFVQNSIPSPQSSLGEIYDKYKSADGFLYVNYCAENTFG